MDKKKQLLMKCFDKTLSTSSSQSGKKPPLINCKRNHRATIPTTTSSVAVINKRRKMNNGTSTTMASGITSSEDDDAASLEEQQLMLQIVEERVNYYNRQRCHRDCTCTEQGTDATSTVVATSEEEAPKATRTAKTCDDEGEKKTSSDQEITTTCAAPCGNSPSPRSIEEHFAKTEARARYAATAIRAVSAAGSSAADNSGLIIHTTRDNATCVSSVTCGFGDGAELFMGSMYPRIDDDAVVEEEEVTVVQEAPADDDTIIDDSEAVIVTEPPEAAAPPPGRVGRATLDTMKEFDEQDKLYQAVERVKSEEFKKKDATPPQSTGGPEEDDASSDHHDHPAVPEVPTTEPGAYHVGTPNDYDDQMAAEVAEAAAMTEQQPQEADPEAALPAPAATRTATTTPTALETVVAWVHGGGGGGGARRSHRRTQGNDDDAVTASQSSGDTQQQQQHQVVEGTTVYQAEAAQAEDDSKHNHQRGCYAIPLMGILGVLVLIVIIVIMILGLLGIFQDTNDNNSHTNHGTNTAVTPPSPSPPTSPEEATVAVTQEEEQFKKSTLQQIKEDGVLKVIGYNEFFPFYYTNEEDGKLTGLEYAIVKAIAAAIFGTTDDDDDDPPIEVVSDVTTSNVFSTLAHGGAAHLILRTVSWTMERQVFQAQAKQGLSQAGVYVYDGTRVAGDPFFVKCAETYDHLGDCRDLMICVGNQTTQQTLLEDKLPSRNVAILETHSLVYEAFINGTCNTFLHETASSQEYIVRSFGYEGEYAVSPTLLTKETGAIVTRGDDPEFTAFVNSVLHALFIAEQHNITQSNADKFPTTTVFGEEYKHMFQNALAASGNYGEIYDEFLGPLIPRQDIIMNYINDGTTGQIMTLKLGDIDNDRGTVPLSDKMQSILNRGKLYCGIRTGRPGFAMEIDGSTSSSFEGMDVDYCRALSAALFQGGTTPEQLELVPFETQQDGFQLLAQGDVDVIAGGTWDLANYAKEPSTGIGFSFSEPYYYNNGFDVEAEDNFALATMPDDHDWSSFVYWVASALVYAEEHNINEASSNQMPEVFVYGSALKRIFRDAVLTVGSYGGMYERNLEPLYPRSGGRNMLNAIPNLGPQFYSLPGLIDN